MDRVEAAARRRFAEAGAAAPPLLVTGPAGIGRDLTQASAASLEGTTLATIAAGRRGAARWSTGAPLLALVPLATIAVSVWVALNGLALLTLIPGVYLVNVSKVFAVVLLYGAGTDYCLFLISRYREEMARGHDGPAAIRGAVGHVGGALTASAGTVVWGLGLMVFAEFAKVRCAGPAIALALAVALLASLTLTPALLTPAGPVGVLAGPSADPCRPARHAVSGTAPAAWWSPVRWPCWSPAWSYSCRWRSSATVSSRTTSRWASCDRRPKASAAWTSFRAASPPARPGRSPCC